MAVGMERSQKNLFNKAISAFELLVIIIPYYLLFLIYLNRIFWSLL